MVDAYVNALQTGNNGYSPSYGLPDLRAAIAQDERRKGWPAKQDDIYVCHGVTEALQVILAATLEEGDIVLPLTLIIHLIWRILKCLRLLLWSINWNRMTIGNWTSTILNQK